MIEKASIRLRMTIWFLMVQVAGLIVFGSVMCLLYRQTLVSGKQRTLQQRSRRIAEFLHRSNFRTERELGESFSVLTATSGEGLYMRVRDASGGYLFQQHDAKPLAALDCPASRTNGETPSVLSFQGQPFMVLCTADVFRGQQVVILVGGSTRDVSARLSSFIKDLSLSGMVLIFFASLTTWTVSKRALRPIHELILATRAISTQDLASRLPVPETGDEVEQLALAWNDLLSLLEAAGGELRRFTADASHELRSPLAMISAMTEHTLLHCDISPEVHSNLSEVHAECLAASSLLQQMLYLARADSGLRESCSGAVGIVPGLEEAMLRARLNAETKHQTLRFDRPEEEIWIEGADDDQLRRLWFILLDNAIKYTPVGGEVKLWCVLLPQQATVHIQDNGKGMELREIPYIFERFYRVKDATDECEQPGTGLGLAIARQIAINHAGSIDVLSSPGKGSEFSITLPRQRLMKVR